MKKTWIIGTKCFKTGDITHYLVESDSEDFISFDTEAEANLWIMDQHDKVDLNLVAVSMTDKEIAEQKQY